MLGIQHFNQSSFHCFQFELEFGNVGFCGGTGKPEYPEKNPRSRDENQQQTKPTYDAETWNRTRATLVGGKCSHHCGIPPPQYWNLMLDSYICINSLDYMYCTCNVLMMPVVFFIILWMLVLILGLCLTFQIKTPLLRSMY